MCCYLLQCSVLSGLLLIWCCGSKRPAKSRDLLLGSLLCVRSVLGFAFGSSSGGGGSFGSLGATDPWNDSPRARGGPWAPPPRFDVSIHCSSLSPYACAMGDVFCLVGEFAHGKTQANGFLKLRM